MEHRKQSLALNERKLPVGALIHKLSVHFSCPIMVSKGQYQESRTATEKIHCPCSETNCKCSEAERAKITPETLMCTVFVYL